MKTIKCPKCGNSSEFVVTYDKSTEFESILRVAEDDELEVDYASEQELCADDEATLEPDKCVCTSCNKAVLIEDLEVVEVAAA